MNATDSETNHACMSCCQQLHYVTRAFLRMQKRKMIGLILPPCVLLPACEVNRMIWHCLEPFDLVGVSNEIFLD